MSSKDAEKALANRKKGTFLVRLSATAEGMEETRWLVASSSSSFPLFLIIFPLFAGVFSISRVGEKVVRFIDCSVFKLLFLKRLDWNQSPAHQL